MGGGSWGGGGVWDTDGWEARGASSCCLSPLSLPYSPEQEIVRLEAQKRHQQRLLAQMDARREAKGREREELLEEGRRIRRALAEERELLEAVRLLKLQQLEAAGVPQQYHAQLARMQVAPPGTVARAK